MIRAEVVRKFQTYAQYFDALFSRPGLPDPPTSIVSKRSILSFLCNLLQGHLLARNEFVWQCCASKHALLEMCVVLLKYTENKTWVVVSSIFEHILKRKTLN